MKNSTRIINILKRSATLLLTAVGILFSADDDERKTAP